MKIQPFFARFLEHQEPRLAPESPTMKTMKYPSDNDAQDISRYKMFRREVLPKKMAEMFRPEALPAKPFDTFRRDVLQAAQSGLKEATPAGSPGKPGDVVTLKFPSDSDSIGKFF